MPRKVPVTSQIMSELYDNTILLKYNCPAPAGGKYGWLVEGSELSLYSGVMIEQNVGLYGGPYKPMVGGRPSSGFTSVGAFTYSYSSLPDGLSVGRYCSISTGLRFIDSRHPLDLLTTSALTFRPQNPLFKDFMTDAILEHARGYSAFPGRYPKIGHDVWIGSNVTISMGVEVGTGAVLASNSTVTRDVPPYAIVGGNPAKVIKYRFDEGTVSQLLLSHWWDYDPKQVFNSVGSDFTDLLQDIRSGKTGTYEFAHVELS